MRNLQKRGSTTKDPFFAFLLIRLYDGATHLRVAEETFFLRILPSSPSNSRGERRRRKEGIFSSNTEEKGKERVSLSPFFSPSLTGPRNQCRGGGGALQYFLKLCAKAGGGIEEKVTARDEWLDFDDGRRFDERSADRLAAIMPTCTQINVCHLLVPIALVLRQCRPFLMHHAASIGKWTCA